MRWVEYGGQDTVGYDFIGTDTVKLPITAELNITDAVKELQRRCGSRANIKLFKEET